MLPSPPRLALLKVSQISPVLQRGKEAGSTIQEPLSERQYYVIKEVTYAYYPMDNISLQMELKSNLICWLYKRNSIFATEYSLKGWGSFRRDDLSCCACYAELELSLQKAAWPKVLRENRKR